MPTTLRNLALERHAWQQRSAYTIWCVTCSDSGHTCSCPVRQWARACARARAEGKLLCSDGLMTMVSDRHIAALIRPGGTDVQAICEALVMRANANGGEDNISVVLAYRDEERARVSVKNL